MVTEKEQVLIAVLSIELFQEVKQIYRVKTESTQTVQHSGCLEWKFFVANTPI